MGWIYLVDSFRLYLTKEPSNTPNAFRMCKNIKDKFDYNPAIVTNSLEY